MLEYLKKDVAQLDIQEMRFEPENELLVLKCGLPECELVFVDWKNKNLLKTDQSLKSDKGLRDFKFNTQKPSQLLLLWKDRLEVVELDRSHFVFRKKVPFSFTDIGVWH